MRLDHLAYRVKDRIKTAQFFIEAFGYTIQTEFDIPFQDGSTTKCIALEPPEKVSAAPWTMYEIGDIRDQPISEYHIPPEIFVSDGSPDSIVGKWVAAREVGGIHHLAYQVKSVEAKMIEWREKGYAEFTTTQPLKCPGLVQVFTKPSDLTGVIYEFIEREKHGFCQNNVKDLMLSTKNH